MQIEIYTSDTCHYCELVKKHLDSLGVAYTEYNLSTHLEYIQQLNNLGYTVIPITVIDGHIVVGFNPSELDRLIL